MTDTKELQDLISQFGFKPEITEEVAVVMQRIGHEYGFLGKAEDFRLLRRTHISDNEKLYGIRKNERDLGYPLRKIPRKNPEYDFFFVEKEGSQLWEYNEMLRGNRFPDRCIPDDLKNSAEQLGIIPLGMCQDVVTPDESKVYFGFFGQNGVFVKDYVFFNGQRSYYAVKEDSPIFALNMTFRKCLADWMEQKNKPPIMSQTKHQYWIVSVNGAPISSQAELKEHASEFIENPEHLEDFCEKYWEACFQTKDPNATTFHLIDEEPLLATMISFIKAGKQIGMELTETADPVKSITEIVATAAAGAMLRGGLSDHFIYTTDGALVINTDNPPTLEKGYEMVRRVMEMESAGDRLKNYSAWTLGMIADQLELWFGDSFDPTEVMQMTKKAYNTYITSLNVFREYWLNRDNRLTFTHYKETHYSKLKPDEKNFVLETSARLAMTTLQQRKLKSYVRVYGTEALEQNPPQTWEDLEERIANLQSNRKYVFFLATERQWFEYQGPFQAIPNGAHPIIDLGNGHMLNQAGNNRRLALWNPDGRQTDPMFRPRTGHRDNPTHEEVENGETIAEETPPPNAAPAAEQTVEAEAIPTEANQGG